MSNASSTTDMRGRKPPPLANLIPNSPLKFIPFHFQWGSRHFVRPKSIYTHCSSSYRRLWHQKRNLLAENGCLLKLWRLWTIPIRKLTKEWLVYCKFTICYIVLLILQYLQAQFNRQLRNKIVLIVKTLFHQIIIGGEGSGKTALIHHLEAYSYHGNKKISNHNTLGRREQGMDIHTFIYTAYDLLLDFNLEGQVKIETKTQVNNS